MPRNALKMRLSVMSSVPASKPIHRTSETALRRFGGRDLEDSLIEAIVFSPADTVLQKSRIPGGARCSPRGLGLIAGKFDGLAADGEVTVEINHCNHIVWRIRIVGVTKVAQRDAIAVSEIFEIRQRESRVAKEL